jgi:23S rRNA pseudouridine2605 synthase
MRLQKVLRDHLSLSRRKCDELVQLHQVKVNGERVNEPTVHLKEGDEIEAGGKTFTYHERDLAAKPFVLLFHKPKGVISTHSDPEGRRTVIDCLPLKYKNENQLWAFAGRLDFNSRGLMILSTDGAFVNALIHPSNGHSKEYLVKIRKPIDHSAIKKLSTGFSHEGETYYPFKYKCLSDREISIEVTEGKKHLVRTIIELTDNSVTDLLRTRIGPYLLDGLLEGAVREVIV